VNLFLQRVEANILAHRLIPRGQKILVGVSGGVDSMVLLAMLRVLAAKNAWEIWVAHFNHQLRGRASDADERLVRQAAAKMKLRFFAGGNDVAAFAKQAKISVEMGARKLRHEFLAGVARKHRIHTIALAHHADDQVELFFLRLLRGAGGDGLAGMKWRSPSPAGKNISLIRPLLGCFKAELEMFARENKIRFRNDATNFDSDLLRNRIRNELLPLLRENYQPAVDKAVLRLMDIVGAEAELAGQIAASNRTAKTIRKNLSKQPVAVQRRMLRDELQAAGVAADFDLVESLRARAGKFVSVSPSQAVARDDCGGIQIRAELSADFNPAEVRLKLAARAGQKVLAGRNIRWQIDPARGFGRPEKGAGIEYFDADKVGSAITLRHWRPGDRFQPIGMRSAVKLQDLFVNAKIPLQCRRELLLAATAGGEIFWVEGLRIGEIARLTKATKRRLSWEQSKFGG